MNYSEWEQSVPPALTSDPLWTVTAYRLAVFLGDVAWQDVTKLYKDRRMSGLTAQLYEAVGSMSANIAEGYSRGSTKDRARFYEYALGSARESRDWYYKSRHILGEEVVTHRMALITEIVRLLLTMIPDQRGHAVRETRAAYRVEMNDDLAADTDAGKTLQTLLNSVPFAEP